MPKEITHFALARTLGRSISETSLFYGPVKKFPTLFLLGAVAPDIPFYYLVGPARTAVQDLSFPFHCARALSSVLAFLERDSSPAALALAAGVMCHILADTQFHPLVYYYAGMDGIHPGATGRHRTFETAMDLHFWFLFRGETRLNRVVRAIEVSKSDLSRLLAGLFRPGPPLPDNVPMKALSQHRCVQFLFRAAGIRKGLAWLSQKGWPLPEKISGLAYPFDQPVCLSFFNGPICYKDPCTREPVSTDLSTMINRTVASGQRVLDIVSQAIAAGRVQESLDHPGLPLIRPALPASNFGCWNQKQDIRPLVFQGVTSPF